LVPLKSALVFVTRIAAFLIAQEFGQLRIASSRTQPSTHSTLANAA
jgi:hypothetical protein